MCQAMWHEGDDEPGDVCWACVKRMIHERNDARRERNEARKVARLFLGMADRLHDEKRYEEDIEVLVSAPFDYTWLKEPSPE